MTQALTYAAAILLFALLVYLPGLSIARLLLRDRVAGSLVVPSTFVLGFTFWIGLMFTLGATGLERDGVVWAVVILVSLACLLQWFYGERRMPACSGGGPPGRPTRWSWQP
jgi:hypothetical protein